MDTQAPEFRPAYTAPSAHPVNDVPHARVLRGGGAIRTRPARQGIAGAVQAVLDGRSSREGFVLNDHNSMMDSFTHPGNGEDAVPVLQRGRGRGRGKDSLRTFNSQSAQPAADQQVLPPTQLKTRKMKTCAGIDISRGMGNEDGLAACQTALSSHAETGRKTEVGTAKPKRGPRRAYDAHNDLPTDQAMHSEGGAEGGQGHGQPQSKPHAPSHGRSSMSDSQPAEPCKVMLGSSMASSRQSQKAKKGLREKPQGTASQRHEDTTREPGGRPVVDVQASDASGVDVPAASNKKGRARGKNRASNTNTPEMAAAGLVDGAAIAAAIGGRKGGRGNGRTPRRWWESLDVDDPISLNPICRLRREPFSLPADEQNLVPVYFDGIMLANYLVSSGNFVHPVSRRALKRTECVALDAYCTHHRLGSGCVTEMFDEKERLNDPDERLRMLREQATSIMNAFFSRSHREFRERREGGHHAAPRNSSMASAAPPPAPPRHTQDDPSIMGGLIDDDEVGSFMLDDSHRSSTSGWNAPQLPPAEVHWPSLGGSGYAPAASSLSRVTTQGDAGGGKEVVRESKMMVAEEDAVVFHVSSMSAKWKTKHITNMLLPYHSHVKWIDDHGALVMAKGGSYEQVLRAITNNNPFKLSVMTLKDFQRAVEAKATFGPRAEDKVNTPKHTYVPGPGELRFMLAQMLQGMNKKDEEAYGVARSAWLEGGAEIGEDEDEDLKYQQYLSSRWAQRAIAANTPAGSDSPAAAAASWEENDTEAQVKTPQEACAGAATSSRDADQEVSSCWDASDLEGGTPNGGGTPHEGGVGSEVVANLSIEDSKGVAEK